MTTSGLLFTFVHQGRDAVAAKVMPFLGNAAILAVAVSTYLAWGSMPAFALSLRGNVPINQRVQSWDTEAPPDNWQVHRDRWKRLHGLRTFFAVTGFVLVLASIVLV